MQARNILILILLGTFFVSLIFSFHYRISPTVDAKAYTRIARNMAAGLGYIEHIENAGRPAADDAIVRVGPGYEFFLAGLYVLAGGQNLPLVWVAQALLRALTVFLVYKIARILFLNYENHTLTALLAAGIVGFFPDLIMIGGMLLAETLFLVLLAAAFYYSLLLLEERQNLYLWASAILWGLASFIRPTAIPMILFLVAILAYQKNWTRVALLLLPTVVLLGGWSVRNSIVYGRPLFTTTAGSYALWVGNNSGATGGYDKTPQIQEFIEKYHSVELSKKAFGDYVAFLFHRPFKFAELQFRKTILYFSLLRPAGTWIYLADKPIDRIITLGLSAAATGFLFVFGSAGAYLYFRKKIQANLFFFGMFILQPLVVIPMYVETRYRHPLYLFLALFAAYALVVFFKRFSSLRPFLWSLLVFIMISGIDVFYSFTTIVEKLRLVFSTI